MQALAIKAKQLLTKGMSEQQVIELLVKEGTPVRLAQQAVAAAQISEAPIQMDPSEPNNPTVYGHEKANPMTLKGRIMQARAQLKELAKMADSNDIEVWEQITKLAKGGMFMGLEQNFEQIRHGIGELAKKRRKGGTGSRGINRGIGEVDQNTSKQQDLGNGFVLTCPNEHVQSNQKLEEILDTLIPTV
jgi:hypothetical protein